MSVKWKICGMRNPENIQEVAALSPDFMGFIFYRDSPRYVGEEFVMPTLSSGIKKTGVFVNSSEEEIISKVKTYSLDYVQVHGDEPADFCARLQQEGIKIIKVFRVNDQFDFAATHEFEKSASYFLFDTSGKKYGGNAIAFDWSMLKNYNQRIPFFLSGGITAENVKDIHQLKDMNLYAVDINSGAEMNPGIKSIDRLTKITDQL